MRAALGLAVGAVLCCAMAVEGVGPPGRSGKLTFLEQLQVRGGRAAVSDAVERSRFGQAAAVMDKIIALREGVQGSKHWETSNARLEQESWLRIARLSAKQQQKMTEVLVLCAKAREARDAEQAEKLFRRALALCKAAAGEENAETANCYANVAAVLERQAKYPEAMAHFRKALASSRAARGDNHPYTASRYLSIGSLLDRLGRHEDARPYYQKALAIRRAALGEEHPHTAQSYNNVATNLDDLGDPEEAGRYFERSLAIHRRTLGEDHPETLVVVNNLALNLQQRGRYARAQPLLGEALAARLRVRGERHLETAISYNSLGGNLLRQGKADEARLLFEKALTIRQALLSDRHPAVANSYENLATCYANLGELERARGLQEKALSVHRVFLGEDHRLTRTSYNNLALTLAGQGRAEDAVALYRMALGNRRAAEGPAALGRAIVHGNLALALHKQGQGAAAKRACEEGLALVEAAVGESHALAVIFYANLGGMLGRSDARAARSYAEKSLAVSRKVLGEGHPYTAQSYHSLANALTQEGKRAEAGKLYDRALASLRATVGEGNASVAMLASDAATNLASQGQYARAVALYRPAVLPLERDRLARAPTGFDRAVAGQESLSTRLLLAGALARLGRVEEAWSEAEAGHARGLLDDWAARPEGQSERALVVRLRSLDDRLTPLLATPTLTADQRALRGELRAERKEVQTALSQLAVQRSQFGLLSRREVQKALPADGALVMWVDAPFAPHVCVLRSEGPPRWALMPGTGAMGAWTDEDSSLPERAYEALTDLRVSLGERGRRLEALRRQRIGPVEKFLKSEGERPAVKRLFVVPTGRMEVVPAELLAPGMTVSYVPSGSVLARLARQHRPFEASSVLAVGDPAFDVTRPDRPRPPAHGLLLILVLPGSNAARADLRAGDVILSYNGARLTRLADLRPAGARGVVKRWRGGEEKEVRLDGGPIGAFFDKRPIAEALKAWEESTPFGGQRGTGHTKLPGTRWEAESLRALVGADKVTLLLGSDASEQKLDELRQKKALTRFRVLHLGTHGEVNWGAPQRSALVLAQDRLAETYRQVGAGTKVYDGRLTVGTILREWQLDADLVVLSACETGRGVSTSGEGPLGFAQAFLQKGARSVVLSRWKVDDVATALLMRRFYENLLGKTRGLKGAMGRAEALAEAKRWLAGLGRKEAEGLAAHLAGGTLRGTVVDALPAAKGKAPPLPGGERPFAHPFYWAAFVLIGGPE